MLRSFAPLKHLTQLLLTRSPSLRTMTTTPSPAPFANSCDQLDKLIKKLESDLGVQEPFDVKKALSAQGKPEESASAAPKKAAATGAAAGAAASSGAPAQDAAAKPKKEKVDKPAAPPKAPPVRRSPCSSVLASKSSQAAAIPDIEKIDMRVGLIVSAGTLYCLQCASILLTNCQRSTLMLTACKLLSSFAQFISQVTSQVSREN
jgi:hypothetical protein